jgi:hypothetical protein
MHNVEGFQHLVQTTSDIFGRIAAMQVNGS